MEEELERIKPTHVIVAAGLTGRPNVDWCETHQEETIRTNVIGTLNIADLCSQRGIHCTIFATGCIFEYDKEHQIGEADARKKQKAHLHAVRMRVCKGN